jgi:hypothetical protein
VKLSELWRLSSPVYKEVSFQSIFSLRSGSAIPRSGNKNIKQLVANARVSTLISKLITAFFMTIFAAVAFLPLTMSNVGPPVPKEIAVLGSVSAFLAIVLFLLVFMGLQVSTSFVSSKIVDVLSPLPLSKKDISRIVFLCFVRIFDIPLIAAPLVLLVVYSFVVGSVPGTIILLVSVLVTEIFALALNIALARFFYSKVASPGGRSKWQTFSRFIFMLIWILPTLGAYIIVNLLLNSTAQIVQSFAYLTQGLSSFSILVLVYPFSYGFLVSYATFFNEVNYVALGLSATASVAYVIVAYYCLRWVTENVRKMGIGAMTRGPREAVKDTLIRPQIPWLGIIRKDLRVASRAPSYASLFLFPALQTAVLAISFSSISDIGLSAALGILTGITMITLLLPPTLLSIEGLASAYTRHLPMRKITLITAKTFLSTLTYVISLIVLLIVALFMEKSFFLILTLGVIHGFSLTAAVVLELTILTRKFWKEGFAVGNLYSRITSYILILIPGYILAAVPIVSAFVTFLLAPSLFLPVFLAVAVAEFTIMTAVVLLQK